VAKASGDQGGAYDDPRDSVVKRVLAAMGAKAIAAGAIPAM
jgi:hypothetical protein